MSAMIILLVASSFAASLGTLETNQPFARIAKRAIDDGVLGDEIYEDKKRFRGMVLQNGMRILLISRPDIDKAAASMQINVGPIDDPSHLQGMAELLGHIVYSGTNASDEYDTFDYFTQNRGGHKSVSIFLELTYHYFGINADHLLSAMMKFSQLFTTSPTWSNESIEAAVSVLKSKRHGRNRDDMNRFKSVEKMPISSNRAIRKFSCPTDRAGSIDAAVKANLSLLSEELRKFHKKFYTPNRMILVVYGKESLDELTNAIVPLFERIQKVKVDGAPEPAEWINQTHPYASPDNSGYKLKYVALTTQADNVLSVYFGLPDLLGQCDGLAPEYVVKFFNNKLPGSLISTLVGKNLAKSSSLWLVQYDALVRGAGVFRIQVDLTLEGVSNIDKILYEIFAYASYLKVTPVDRYALDQLKRERKLEKLQAKHEMDVTLRYAYLMEIRKMERVFDLECPMTKEQVDKQIADTLSYLRPDNVNYLIGSRSFQGQTDMFEECTGAEYSMGRISQEELTYYANASLDESRIKLLTKRQHISRHKFTDNASCPVTNSSNAQKYPKLLYEDDRKRLWWLNHAMTKHAFFAFKIPSQHGHLLVLLKDILSQEAAKHFKTVTGAGYYFSFHENERGFAIQTNYAWKDLPNFLRKAFEIFVKNRTDPTIFLNAKRVQLEKLTSILNGQPINIAGRYVNEILESPTRPYSPGSKEPLEALSIDEFNKFRSTIFSTMSIESMFYGDKDEQENAINVFNESVQAIESVTNFKPLDPAVPNFNRAVKLPYGASFIYEKSLRNQLETVVMVCFQSQAFDDLDFLTAELLQRIIRPKCVGQLKTVEGLGNQVICKSSKAYSSNKFCISVQGYHNVSFIDSRIEALILGLKTYLQGIQSVEFAARKNSFIREYVEKLDAGRELFWSDITGGEYFFNMDEEYMKILQNVTMNDLMSYVDRVFDKRSPERKKLAIYLHSTDSILGDLSKSNEEMLIQDVEKFKDEMGLYPEIMPRLPLQFPY